MCQFAEEGNVVTEDPVATVEDLAAEMVQQALEGLEGEMSNSAAPLNHEEEGRDGEQEEDHQEETPQVVAPPPGFAKLRSDPEDLHLQLEGMALEDDMTSGDPEADVYPVEGYPQEEYYPEWHDGPVEQVSPVYQAPVMSVPQVEAYPGQVVGSIDDFRGLVAAGMPTPAPGEVHGPLVFWGPDEAGRFVGGPAHLLPGYFMPAATQVQDLPGSYPQPSPPVSHMSPHHHPVTKPVPQPPTMSPKRVEELSGPEKGHRCNSVDSGHDDTFSETGSVGFDASAEPAQPQVAYDVNPEEAQHVIYEEQPYYPEAAYDGYAPVEFQDGSYGYYEQGNGYYDDQYVPYGCHVYPDPGQAMVYPGYYSDQTVVAAPFASYQVPVYQEYGYGQ